jgi:excisionase family DNA binding protein
VDTREYAELISIREAARIANVSYQTVWRAVSRSEVPVYRVGEAAGPLRLRRDEFLAWLLEHEVAVA